MPGSLTESEPYAAIRQGGFTHPVLVIEAENVDELTDFYKAPLVAGGEEIAFTAPELTLDEVNSAGQQIVVIFRDNYYRILKFRTQIAGRFDPHQDDRIVRFENIMPEPTASDSED